MGQDKRTTGAHENINVLVCLEMLTICDGIVCSSDTWGDRVRFAFGLVRQQHHEVVTCEITTASTSAGVRGRKADMADRRTLLFLVVSKGEPPFGVISVILKLENRVRLKQVLRAMLCCGVFFPSQESWTGVRLQDWNILCF